MFWRFNYSTSQLQTLLDKEDVSLKEIMDEEDVLQECKSNNEKLVNFLIKPEVLNELVENTIFLPSDELTEKERFKYSTISCELLTTDISTINDSLIDNVQIMDKLYSFLVDNNQDSVNPLMASYFAKVVGCLITRKTESFLNYIQTKEDFLVNFLKNINTSAITDILLRFLTTIDSNELRNKVILWLKNINLVNGLISLFSHENSNEVHSNASQILCDIIRISRDQVLTQREISNECFMSHTDIDSENENMNQEQIGIEYLHKNSLLEQIESGEVLGKMLSLIIDSVDHQTNCSLVYGIEILLTILEPASWTNEIELNESQNLDEEKLKRDRERVDIALYGIKLVEESCLNRLGKFHDLLINIKPKIEHTNLSNGSQVALFGTNRLALVKLISKLICLNDPKINQELIRLGTLNVILFKDIITNCFISDFKAITKFNKSKNEQDVEMSSEENEDEKEIKRKTESEYLDKTQVIENVKVEDVEAQTQKNTFIKHFLHDCNLIKKLIHAWSQYFDGIEKITDKKIVLSKSNSVGYVGHLTLVSNLIYRNSKDGKYSVYIQDCLNKFVDKDVLETWVDLNENNISKLNFLNSKDLVRNPFLTSSVSTTETPDFIDLPSDERMNKKFADLQKEMKINCVEDFSISESQIVNFSTKSTSSSTGTFQTKSKTISFAVESNDESAQMFEQVCLQRDNMNLTSNVGNSCNLDEDVWVTKEIQFSENALVNNTTTAKSNSTFEIKENWAVFSSEKDIKLKKELSHKASKKQAEKLALTNYSSSSSSSSDSSSSSSSDQDDDDPTPGAISSAKLEQLRNRNKRHHHQNQNTHSHKESKYKETKEEVVDLFKSGDLFGMNVNEKQTEPKTEQSIEENWADFGQFLSQEANQNANKNILDAIQDPWQSGDNEPSKAESKEEGKDDWANFDNFS